MFHQFFMLSNISLILEKTSGENLCALNPGFLDLVISPRYGLKAFNVTGAPKTLAEAQERPVYAMVFWQHLQLQCLGRMVSHVMEAVFLRFFQEAYWEWLNGTYMQNVMSMILVQVQDV